MKSFIMKLKTALSKNIEHILIVVAAFLAMVVVGYSYVSGIVGSLMSVNGNNILDSAEATIKTSLVRAEVSLSDVVFSIETMREKVSSPEDFREIIRGWSNMYNESSDLIDFSALYGYIDGEVLFRTDWTPTEGWGPTARPWYIGAVEKKGGIFYSNPYVDKFTGKVIITLSAVISENGIFDPDKAEQDVFGIDVPVSGLSAYISSLELGSGGYGILLSDDLMILSHRDESFIGDYLTGGAYSPVNEALSGAGHIEAFRFTDYDKTDSICFFRQIYNGWYVGVVSPVTGYYSQVYRMAAALTALAVFLVILLSYFIIRLNSAKLQSDEENRSKTSFLAKMSHELRTPINTISGMNELILRENISPAVQEHAGGIKRASADLLTIINDILDFSKIEGGNLKLVRAKYNFSSLITDVLGTVRARLSGSSVLFVSNIDSFIPNELIGDDLKVRQIMLNLLLNAVNYTQEGFVSISVTGKIEDDETALLTIKISDSGVGISPEDIPKLFAGFGRIENDQPASPGAGLGLAITKNLCETMGGSISASSVLGRGSTFTVQLPQKYDEYNKFASVISPETKSVLVYETRVVYSESITRTLSNLGVSSASVTNQSEFYEQLRERDFSYIFASSYLADTINRILNRLDLHKRIVLICEGSDTVAAKHAKTLSMPAHSLSIANLLNQGNAEFEFSADKDDSMFIAPSARVLVVDDIITNLMVAEGLMSPYRMQLDTCTSGAEAIELVRKNKYDLVFMDHMMPGMDGIETTRRIRDAGKTEYYQKLPIVALTANAIDGVKDIFIQGGLNDYLSKPIDTAKLHRILQKWIPVSKRERYTEDSLSDSPVFEIDGIDVNLGIAMTGGNTDFYIGALSVFYKDSAKKIVEIKAALDEGDIPLYTTYVHAVKGASQSLGAIDLSDTAKLLELAGLGGDTVYINENTPLFLEQIKRLLENIITVIPQKHAVTDVTEVSADTELLHSELTKLKDALASMEMRLADRILSGLQRISWFAEINDLLDCVEHSILLCDYGEAQDQIAEILEK
ncbi:MAG: response regulator [Oscillospiraceae bacterium]|jgi:signal transduction histidine kinase/AmiR/NasT family two-component response regulator/HPt (histidine-containing phosphotransfer) domain-containing protein|nr:response regulator [Oscillospiraceae bacterium]